MYGVCFTCLGRLHSYSSIEQDGIKSFLSTPLLWLTVFSLFLIAATLPLLLSFTAIFVLIALLILLTACLPSFRCLAAQDLPLSLIPPILSTSLMQELTSILSLSSLCLVNSGTLPASVFPSAYDLNSFKREVSRHLSRAFGFWSRTFPGTGTSVGIFLFCFIFVALGRPLLHKRRKIVVSDVKDLVLFYIKFHLSFFCPSC